MPLSMNFDKNTKFQKSYKSKNMSKKFTLPPAYIAVLF